jgi:hypothetical protein
MNKHEYNQLLGIIVIWTTLIIVINMVVCWAWQLGPYAVR